MNIIVIGLGGIGTALTRDLCRYLQYLGEDDIKMTLVDGDKYEPKNYERQDFIINNMGNKASVKADELEIKFPKIQYNTFEHYINENNIGDVIKNNSIVFLCVDNHKTRMIVNNYCRTLNDVTLISGGNELIDGNIQAYVREGGVDLTADLCKYHPEIANPNDKLPDEMSCEELSISQPQLLFTNAVVAIFMCCMFLNIVFGEEYDRSETYIDIRKMTVHTSVRKI